MTRLRWAKFWWDDWLTDPGLNQCSLAAQGLWLRMLCLMAHAEPPGRLLVNGKPPTIKQIGRALNVDTRVIPKLLDELRINGVYDASAAGVIISRRMQRDFEMHQQGQRDIAKRWGKPPNRPPNRGNGPDNPGVESQEESNRSEGHPPDPPRGGRARGFRSGFNDAAADMMEVHDDAAADDPRPGGARVVSIAGRAVRG